MFELNSFFYYQLYEYNDKNYNKKSISKICVNGSNYKMSIFVNINTQVIQIFQKFICLDNSLMYGSTYLAFIVAIIGIIYNY